MRKIKLLIAAAAAVAGIWGFIEIADRALEAETISLDVRVADWTRRPEDPSMPVGPEILHIAGREITALGGFTVLTLVAAAVTGFLLLQRRPRKAAVVPLALIGGMLFNSVLKSLFNRPRPDLPQILAVTSSSFPSGHAMASAAVYLTLGALAAGMVDQRPLKIHCLLTAMLITLLVGASRVYLGVHYVTDVLAGWLAGAAWALICWDFLQLIENHE